MRLVILDLEDTMIRNARHDVAPKEEVFETELMANLRTASNYLEPAASIVRMHNPDGMYDKIRMLQGEIESMCHNMLVPPAP